MTAKQVFEAVLMELNKLSAPSIDLETFNYFFNKAINLFINKLYNVGVDTDQLRTDDIRVLKTSAILKPARTPSDLSSVISKLLDNKTDGADDTKGAAEVISSDSVYGATYEFNLPADYLHLLNCICIYKVNKRINCPYNVGDIVRKGAIKCNADTWPLIIDNLYMRPTYKRPYYYINNLNTSSVNPTNPLTEDNKTNSSIRYRGTDVATKLHIETGPQYDADKNSVTDTIYKNTENATKAGDTVVNRKYTISINDESSDDDTIVKTAGHRYGNSSNVRLEIRYGLDSSVFELIGISIDYIKAPQFIRLTLELLDLNEDTSQVIEFPDYICQEIINELTKIVMENASDPRLQTNPAISLSIAAPAQALAPTKK